MSGMRWTEFAVREARMLLSDWRQRFQLPEPPIPVEDIADLFYHLAIDPTDALPANTAGRLYIDNRIIEVRRSDIPVRQRFTIAHEIGHYRLHAIAERLKLDGHSCAATVLAADAATLQTLPGFEVGPLPSSSLSAQDRRRIEIEANAFAAELLMPAALIEQAVSSCGCDISALAEQFAVSQQAMQYRLEHLRFLRPAGPQTSFL